MELVNFHKILKTRLIPKANKKCKTVKVWYNKYINIRGRRMRKHSEGSLTISNKNRPFKVGFCLKQIITIDNL
jgi:hypothetical protein